MSNTLKQAIQALKSRVADAFAAVEAKGGTLPATQDTANLPAAIASIPSGGDAGMYDYLKQIGVADADLIVPNETGQRTIDESNETIGIDKPLVKVGDILNKTFYSDNLADTIEVIVADTYTGIPYQNFFRQRALHTIIIGGGKYVKMLDTGGQFTFFQCSSLRNLFFIMDCTNGVGTITSANYSPSIREIRIKNVGVSLNISKWQALSFESLLYVVQNLQNVSGNTLTIGGGNLTKLVAKPEGQQALTAAQEMGWTIS